MLGALAVATVAVILALRRRRPWDAAMFALAPALLLTATVNWDLLAIGLAAFGLLAWAGNDQRWPACCSGWPARRSSGRCSCSGRSSSWRCGPAGSAPRSSPPARRSRRWSLVNLPAARAYPENWDRFFELNTTRPIDWGTLWYIGRYLDGKVGNDPAQLGPFEWLNANIPTLNTVSYALFGLACLGVAVLALRAPRRPRLAQLAFLVVAAFLIFSKVWSQQFVLWLLPLVVLARPSWGAFLAWQVAEVCYFVAFYGELLGAATGRPVFPEGVFVLASTLRLTTVVVLCVLVVKDILHPERDAVRATYPDDPDGGVLDGAPDAPWVDRWRRNADQRTPPRTRRRHLTPAPNAARTTSGFAGEPARRRDQA